LKVPLEGSRSDRAVLLRLDITGVFTATSAARRFDSFSWPKKKPLVKLGHPPRTTVVLDVFTPIIGLSQDSIAHLTRSKLDLR